MKKQFIPAIFSLVFLFHVPAPAQETLAKIQKIDSLLTFLEQENKMMGAVTISENGKLLFNKAYGYARMSESEKQAANTNTKYRIGSITKMFTATMIFQLIEENKLSLETPLAEYFPQIPNAKSITIAHLLNHRSGLHNFTSDPEYMQFYTEPKSQAEMLELFSRQKPDFSPGAKSDYSNSNYVLLGFILEKITQNSYATELDSRIVSKLGLKNTQYGAKTEIQNNEAFSYSYVNTWKEEAETDMSIPHGAGAIVSSSNDLITFIEALFQGRLITSGSLAKMTTLKEGYGKGIFKIPFYEKSAFGHNGGIDGFMANLSYFPEEGLAIAFCSNGLNYNMNEIIIGVLSLTFGHEYTFPVFNKSITLSPEQLKRYEGLYTSTQVPLEIRLKSEGGFLTAQATDQPAFPLEAGSETSFRFDKAGLVIDFIKNDQAPFSSFVLRQAGGEYTFSRKIGE